jgi:hypothetical protein
MKQEQSNDLVKAALDLIHGRIPEAKPKGVTIADVLDAFQGAKVQLSTKFKFEMQLEDLEILEADRLAILEEAPHWVEVKLATPERFWGKRIVTQWDVGNPRAPHSSRKEDDGTWGWIEIDSIWDRSFKEKSDSATCTFCNKDHVPEWRRGGRMVRIIEADGSGSWMCHFCGRRPGRKHNAQENV